MSCRRCSTPWRRTEKTPSSISAFQFRRRAADERHWLRGPAHLFGVFFFRCFRTHSRRQLGSDIDLPDADAGVGNSRPTAAELRTPYPLTMQVLVAKLTGGSDVAQRSGGLRARQEPSSERTGVKFSCVSRGRTRARGFQRTPNVSARRGRLNRPGRSEDSVSRVSLQPSPKTG